MHQNDVKEVFGSLSALAIFWGVKPQSLYQWFDKQGNFIGSDMRRSAIIGAAKQLHKDIPANWCADKAA